MTFSTNYSPILSQPRNSKLRLLCAVAVLTFLAAGCNKPEPAGAVTTANSAIAKARQGWKSVHSKTRYEAYSDENIRRFEPFTATLADGVWTVTPTVPAGYSGEIPVATVRQIDGGTSVTTRRDR